MSLKKDLMPKKWPSIFKLLGNRSNAKFANTLTLNGYDSKTDNDNSGTSIFSKVAQFRLEDTVLLKNIVTVINLTFVINEKQCIGHSNYNH